MQPIWSVFLAVRQAGWPGRAQQDHTVRCPRCSVRQNVPTPQVVTPGRHVRLSWVNVCQVVAQELSTKPCNVMTLSVWAISARGAQSPRPDLTAPLSSFVLMERSPHIPPELATTQYALPLTRAVHHSKHATTTMAHAKMSLALMILLLL